MWQSTHSVVSDTLTREEIWAVWADVEHWKDWDNDIAWSRCEGILAQGAKVILKPKRGPKVTATTTRCEPAHAFTDVTRLPLGTRLTFEHTVDDVGDGIRVTHSVSIKGPLTFLFKRIIGKKIAKHLPSTMENLLKAANKEHYMQKERVTLPAITLAGITVRTNNSNEFNPASAKIGQLVNHYWSEKVADQIAARKNAGTTFAVYTDYESDEHGDYTYLMGEEITDLLSPTPNLQTITIPANTYIKFTTLPGKMPEVIIRAWQEIWEMSPAQLGGTRSYQGDFERYDQRASDPNNSVVEIYIAIT